MHWNIFLKLQAALFALELVIFGIDISESCLKLKIPMLAKNEGIAIGKAGSCSPSFESVVGQWRVVKAEHLEVVRKITEIIDSSQGMDTKEVSGESVTEPIPELRLNQSVLIQSSLWHCPAVIVAGKIECPSWCQTGFNA